MSNRPHPCGHVHYDGMAVAVGRFQPTPDGFRAISGGTLRQSRAEAVADECEITHRQVS